MEPVIRTARLCLRPARPALADALIAGIGQLCVSQWLTRVPYPYTSADAERFLSEVVPPFPRHAFVFENETLIGGVATDDGLGYWLVPEAWGKGFATEAAGALVAHHFADTTDPSIRSSYLTGNHASASVLRKLGFRETGEHRSITPLSTGKPIGLIETRLSRSDWEARG